MERKSIIKSGGQVTVRTSKDADTGEELKITTTKIDKSGRDTDKRTIFEVENLSTGEKTIKTFEDKPGRRRTQTGGIKITRIDSPIPDKVIGPVNITQAQRDKLLAEKIEREGFGFRTFPTAAERQLSLQDIVKGRFGEVGTGIVSATGSIIEGFINLAVAGGTQLIEVDAEGKRIDNSFRFSDESFFGRAKKKPTGTGKVIGQAAVILPLVGGAVTSFSTSVSQLGFKQAVGETIGSFSPLRIPTQSFGALESSKALQKLKFDVVSVKTIKGDVTGRIVTGKARGFDDVFLLSKQVLGKVGGKDVGFAVTDITAPKTTFSLGSFSKGIRSVRVESVIVGTGSGKASIVSSSGGLTISRLLSGTGGGAKVLTRTKAVLDFDKVSGLDFSLVVDGKFASGKLVGAVSKPVNDLTLFTGGKGTRVFRFEKDFGLIESVRVGDINIRGIEFDISKLASKGQFGSGFIAGSKGPRVETQTVTKQLTASLIDVSLPKPTPRLDTGLIAPLVSSITTRQETIFGTPSVFTGTGQFEQTQGVQRLGDIQKDITRTELITLIDVVQIQQDKQRSGARSKLASTSDTIQQERQRFNQELALDTGQQLKQETRLRFKPVQRLITQQTLPQPLVFFGGQGITKLQPPKKFTISISKELRQPLIREVPLFSTQVRRGGIFGTVGTDLTLGEALLFGERRTKQTLARTFRVRRTGRTKQVGGIDEEFTEPDLTMFRRFKQVKGKKEALPSFTFIQKQEFALGTIGERKEIQRLRKEQRELNKIINM